MQKTITHTLKYVAVSVFFVLLASGCTTLERSFYMGSSAALPSQTFHYRDGGQGLYYHFVVGDSNKTDTLVFLYGGSGCQSWKSVMPYYVSGLVANARVYALNKRFVADRSLGSQDCGADFKQVNNLQQWVQDWSEFVSAQIRNSPEKPKNIVLVGVSEGALAATKIASLEPRITHLAIIGSGAYSMRQSLRTLKHQGVIAWDVDAESKQIAKDPQSLTKSWYGHPYRWWSEVLDMDPLPDLLKLDIPVLVGIGEKDASVPQESAQLLQRQFKEAGKTNLKLEIYPDANHRLQSADKSYRSEYFARLSELLHSK